VYEETLMGIFAAIAAWLIGYATQRPYYHLKHADGSAYMERYWLLPKWMLRQTSAGFWQQTWAPVTGTPYREPITTWVPREQYDVRWKWLPAIRIHHTLSSDYDRHLHDHPWPSMSVILRGRYLEVMPRHTGQGTTYDQLPGGTLRVIRRPGDFVLRSSTDRHRLEIANGESCWSMFAIGPKRREWGFHTEDGWVPHGSYESVHQGSMQ
jgi:hypothetical protein